MLVLNMKIGLILSTLVVSCVSLFSDDAAAGSQCPDGWTTFQGSCYFFGHNMLTFHEAEEQCKSHQAHLVHIETATENTFLKSYLADIKDLNHWIGLEDNVIEGIWKWHGSDVTATFTDWGAAQPDGRRLANCAAIWASYQYKWVDESCTNKFYPLCEKPFNPQLCTDAVVG